METKTHTEIDWDGPKPAMLDVCREVLVRLDDAWGCDADIARIARISTGSPTQVSWSIKTGTGSTTHPNGTVFIKE